MSEKLGSRAAARPSFDCREGHASRRQLEVAVRGRGFDAEARVAQLSRDFGRLRHPQHVALVAATEGAVDLAKGDLIAMQAGAGDVLGGFDEDGPVVGCVPVPIPHWRARGGDEQIEHEQPGRRQHIEDALEEEVRGGGFAGVRIDIAEHLTHGRDNAAFREIGLVNGADSQLCFGGCRARETEHRFRAIDAQRLEARDAGLPQPHTAAASQVDGAAAVDAGALSCRQDRRRGATHVAGESGVVNVSQVVAVHAGAVVAEGSVGALD